MYAIQMSCFYVCICRMNDHLYVCVLGIGYIKLLSSSILATWPVHLNLLDLITLTILGEQCKLWSFSLWNLLHFPFASLVRPNIRLRILFSNTPSLRSSLNARAMLHIYIAKLAMLSFYIFKVSILREKSRRQKCLDWIITWISYF